MTETAKYISPKNECLDERARMLNAMNEALANPIPEDRLKGVVTVFKDTQYKVYQRKVVLEPELKILETLSNSPLKFNREGFPYLDWQTVRETPAEAALRIVQVADTRKSLDCAYVAYKFN